MSKICSMIGIGKRGGLIKYGETGCTFAIKKNSCYLLIIARDASENTKKRFINMCKNRRIKYILFASKQELGKSIGKDITATIAVVDKKFANMLLELIK